MFRIFGKHDVKKRFFWQKRNTPSEKQKLWYENKRIDLLFEHIPPTLSKLINHMESPLQWFSSKTGARSACDDCSQLLHYWGVPFVSPYMTYIKTAQKMATGRETRSNPVPRFTVGEKVLCYEPDPNKARVLYESKVNFVERTVFMLVSELTKIL